MNDCAMHVQHKDREVFDRENRVIPRNVIAVSSDTGEYRFGDGVSKWRDLPVFGNGWGDPSETPDSGYSGPLHVSVYAEDEYDTQDESSEVMSRVPGANEMVMLMPIVVVFGNGVSSLGELVAAFNYSDPNGL